MTLLGAFVLGVVVTLVVEAVLLYIGFALLFIYGLDNWMGF